MRLETSLAGQHLQGGLRSHCMNLVMLAPSPGVPPEEPDAQPAGGAEPAFLDRIQRLSTEEGTVGRTESEGSDEAEEDRQHLVVLDPDHVRTPNTCPPAAQACLCPRPHFVPLLGPLLLEVPPPFGLIRPESAVLDLGAAVVGTRSLPGEGPSWAAPRLLLPDARSAPAP